jgi:hypothetical protein
MMSMPSPSLQLTAVYEPAPEGGFTRTFEEFPDVFSEGETLEEAEAISPTPCNSSLPIIAIRPGNGNLPAKP